MEITHLVSALLILPETDLHRGKQEPGALLLPDPEKWIAIIM